MKDYRYGSHVSSGNVTDEAICEYLAGHADKHAEEITVEGQL